MDIFWMSKIENRFQTLEIFCEFCRFLYGLMMFIGIILE